VTRFLVNGEAHDVVGQPGRTLLDVLREDLRLTGTKYGCGEGECGACTVLVDGAAARACTVPWAALDGASVLTVEGLSRDGDLHPVQAAFVAERAMQCGYCTPGMVMSAVALLARNPDPDDDEIRTALAGNICRCGGYPRILAAIRAAAAGAPDVPANGAGAAVSAECKWTVVLSLEPGERDWGWSTPGGARLTIDGDGRITAFIGKVDGGQGNRESLTRLVAAELAIPTAQVLLVMGDTDLCPFDLGTFGSRSTPDAGPALRLVARAAGHELVRRAAEQWQVKADALVLDDGHVREPDSERSIPYAALLGPGQHTVTADPAEDLSPLVRGLSKLDAARLHQDLAAATTGAKRFPCDVTVPDLRYGRVLRPPAHGARLVTVDTSAARQLPGVHVVEDKDFVAVTAATRAAADHALQAIGGQWETTEQPTQAGLEAYVRAHPVEVETLGWGATTEREIGDVDGACAAADVCLTATYTTAYLAHVPLEPRVAVATVDGGRVTIWVGTQRPFAVRADVAAALGLSIADVRVVVPDFGGGFGGKHTADVAIEAARLAWATGRPVQVSWTREEEFRWAYHRPAAIIDVRAAAQHGAAQGNPTLTGWEFTNINAGSAALFTPYEIPHLRERFQPAASPLPQGSYRALAATANTFARESHMDDIATALGVDPVELRIRHLTDERLVAVLTAVAERIDRTGRGVGVACGVEKGARVATAVEVTVDDASTIHIGQIVTAVDCGAVIDPTGLRNQITGATIMGLGGALFEEVRFDQGRILSASLATYRVPRITDIPPIDVLMLDRPDQPSAGAGETPIIAIAPALANAIHAATGVRLRRLPLAPDGRVGSA
jgi:nicotinate dehydrogenase subunit B